MLTILDSALRTALLRRLALQARLWDPPPAMLARPDPAPRRERDEKRRLMAIMELGGRPPF